MNLQQRNYAKAKAFYDTLKEQEQKIEQDYMRKNGIVNADGKTPLHIWCIDDEETFNKANEETAPTLEKLGLHEARELLKSAEDDLIRYGLSIIPMVKERKTLSDRCFGENGKTILLDVRKKVLDLAFKFDTRTLKR